jgi:hypothetical protein
MAGRDFGWKPKFWNKSTAKGESPTAQNVPKDPTAPTGSFQVEPTASPRNGLHPTPGTQADISFGTADHKWTGKIESVDIVSDASSQETLDWGDLDDRSPQEVLAEARRVYLDAIADASLEASYGKNSEIYTNIYGEEVVDSYCPGGASYDIIESTLKTIESYVTLDHTAPNEVKGLTPFIPLVLQSVTVFGHRKKVGRELELAAGIEKPALLAAKAHCTYNHDYLRDLAAAAVSGAHLLPGTVEPGYIDYATTTPELTREIKTLVDQVTILLEKVARAGWEAAAKQKLLRTLFKDLEDVASRLDEPIVPPSEDQGTVEPHPDAAADVAAR